MRLLALTLAPAPAILLALAASPGCAGGAPGRPPGAAPGAPVELSVLATNDVHGQIERLAVFSGYVAALRRSRGEAGAGTGGVLLFDTGDALHGTLESNLDEGATVVGIFNALAYGAMTLGNHEFDFGPAGEKSSQSPPGDPQGALSARLAEARFPVLAANLDRTDGSSPALPGITRSTLSEVAGVRVGQVGVLTTEAAAIIKPPGFDGLVVAPLAEAAIRESRALRERGAEVVILLAHAGGMCTSFDDPTDLASCDGESELFRLVRALPPGLVDVVVGGHRNAGVAHLVAGIPVVHAPSHLAAFSRVDLTFDRVARRVTGRRLFAPRALCTVPLEEGCLPGAYEGKPITPDPAVAQVAGPALDRARAERERRLGVTVSAPLPPGKRSESALGNLFADLMREAVPGADVAIVNAGSLRHSLPAGDLTFGALHRVMPFDNRLARLRLTGRELRAMILANLTGPDRGVLSISGLRIQTRCQDAALEVTLVAPSGSLVPDAADLGVVTHDYLAMGGDGLVGAAGVPRERIELDLGTDVIAALEAGLRRRGSVTPDDPTLLDPKAPRLALPGPLPVKCPSAPPAPP